MPSSNPNPPGKTSPSSHWLLRYGCAMLSVVAAILLREALTRLVGGSLPHYITLYPAVMVSALFGGIGPGLLATAVAALAADYFILPPIGALALATLPDAVGLAFFSGMGVFMSAVAENYRRARRRVAAQDTQAFLREGRQIPTRRFVQGLVLNTGLVAALVILGAAGWQSARNLRAVAAADQWETHTRIVMQQLERLLSAVKDAETGQRGYLLTGEEKYLEPYQIALGVIQTHLIELNQLTLDNPIQQQRLAALESLTQKKLAKLKQTIELRRSQGLSAALAAVSTDTGKSLMDQIRQQVAQAQDEEERLLQERTAAKNDAAGKALQALLAGGVLSFLLLITVFFFLKQENDRRVEAEADVRHHRDHLQELVAARTEALRRSNDQLNLALTSARMATFDWDIVQNRRHWSQGVHDLLGTKPEAFTGTAEEFFQIIHAEDRSTVQAALVKAVEQTGVYQTEYRAVWPDGSIRHIAARGKVHHDNTGRAMQMTAICWDITERRQSEEILQRLNRTLRALSRSSQAMLHATGEDEYMHEVCQDIQDCGHAMVWIGLAENDEAKSVRPVAHAGFEEGYLETLHLTWADTARGRGPTGTAIRTGAPAICQNMRNDAQFGPWREEALKRGYVSSLVLPLADADKTFGAVTIYSRQPNAFPPDEVQLLSELAGDLAHGIVALHRSAALRQHERLLQDIIDGSTSPIFLKDLEGKFITINAALERMLGMSREAIRGKTDYDIAPKELADFWRTHDESVMADGKSIQVEEAADLPDGHHIFLADKFPLVNARGEMYGVGAISHDITVRKQAERDSARLAAIVESSADAIIGKDLDGLITSWNTGAEKMFGYGAGEMLGTPMSRLVPSDRQAEELQVLEIIRRGESVPHFNTVRQARDGRLVEVSVAISPIKDAQGRVVGASKVARDITEYKRVEQELEMHRRHLEELVEERTAALRVSEQEFRSLAESMPQIVWATRPDGWNFYFNQQWEDYTGMTLQESYGHGWNRPFHPEDQHRAWEAWQRATQFNERYSLECRLRRADGVYRWWLIRGVPMRGANGEILKWFGTCTDIEELKHAETALKEANDRLEHRVAERTAALRASEERYRLLAENSADFIVLRDIHDRALYRSPACAHFLGWTDEEEQSTDWRLHVHPEDVPLLEQSRVASARGEANTVIYRFAKKNGAYVWLESLNRPLFGPDGKVTGRVIASRDISERKQAEQQMRLQATALHSAANGIVITRRDGTIEWVNDAFTRLTGYTAAEAVGQNPRVLKSGAHPPEFYGNIWRTVLAGSVWHDEIVNRRKDGSCYTEEMTITPVTADAGTITHFVAIKQDITERKQVAAALAQAKAELERQNEELERRVAERTTSLEQGLKEMERFAYVASHDLQEPLRAVSSFSQLLEQRYRGKLDADADEFITFIVEAATRMQTLINDLLALSRIGTRGKPFEPVAIGEMLQVVKENLGLAIAESGAIITHDPLPTLMADRTQLMQLFQNLFGNAIKFRQPAEPPRIHVSAIRKDSGWQLSVRDKGIGIDPRYFERIFIVFQRLHNRDEYPGTGIGLAICKKIVERHGGRLWVESEPGTGSTFFFTFPDAK